MLPELDLRTAVALAGLLYLVGAFVAMARSVRRGQALADELALRHPALYEAWGRPRPGLLPGLRRDRFTQLLARRGYTALDPPLADAFALHHRAETRLVVTLLVLLAPLGAAALWLRFGPGSP